MSPVTTIIGIRNRYDYRIINALKSLRGQAGFGDHEIILVDYGSDQKHRETFEALCGRFKVQGIWTNVKNEWNRSHCLNIGIKYATSPILLMSDVDIVFEKNYLKACTEALAQNLLQSIYTPMNDLEKEDLSREMHYPDEYENLKKISILRSVKDQDPLFLHGASILCVPREFIVAIRGYDENYKLWSSEEMDLIKRLGFCNIPIRQINNTSHLHQWHPKWENLSVDKNLSEQVRKNNDYYLNEHSVKRNEEGWGEY